MIGKLKSLWRGIVKRKYAAACVVFVLLVGFVSDNSVMKLVKLNYRLSELTTEVEQRRENYKNDSTHLRRLKQDPKEMHRIAREQYYMHSVDEDVYIIK